MPAPREMVSEKFRRQLRHEAEQWWHAGLIDAALYDKLSAQYQFDGLETEARNRFISILMVLGGILLGLGVITFVAANWQAWPRSVKVVLLLSLFVGINATGFYLWRRPITQSRYQRLGHGLLIFGALILGANLALMSQMFHQSGPAYHLFLVWGLGVVVMSYSLRLASLGVLSLILTTIGFWGYRFSGDAVHNMELLNLLVLSHMPLVFALVFVPLAYWCASRAVFGLAAIACPMALSANLTALSGFGFRGSGGIVILALMLPVALLWSHSSRHWRFGKTTGSPASPDPFQPLARSLALWCLALVLYIFSFLGPWSAATSGGDITLNAQDWWQMFDAVILGLYALWGWWQLRHEWSRWHHFSPTAINSGTLGITLILASGAIWQHWNVFPLATPATILFNGLLFLLAITLIRDGLATGNRGPFWGGMVLMVLGIISRTLEYDTGLLLKAFVFSGCGAMVMVAGLWFERKVYAPTARATTPLPKEDNR